MRSGTNRSSSCPATFPRSGWTCRLRPATVVRSRCRPAPSARTSGPRSGRRTTSTDDEPLPLLVVHDGPEYDSLAQLTTYLSANVHAGTLPRLRAALLPPGNRNDRYSAEGAYTRALCLAVIPGLHAEVPTTVTIGMGASLGALAMLHAQRQHPQCFDALFLQSGSFFHPRHDAHERRFSQYERVVRSVATVLRSGGHPSPVPTVMTCGSIEENLANNRIMARALAAQGYDVTLREVRDAHTFTAWRDALDPWLTGLLRGWWRHESPVELVSPDSGFRGQVVVHGHFGRPVLVFPSEAGSAWDFENNGMVEAVRWMVDAGKVKFYCVDSADAFTWSDRSVPLEERARPPRPLRAMGARERRPLRAGRLRRALGHPHARLQPRRLPRREPRTAPRRPLPAGAVPLGLLRPLRVVGLGRARRRGVLPQPDGVRGQPARRPPRLAALGGLPGAGRRPGLVGGRPDPRPAEHASSSPPCWPTRASRTSSTSGVTTSPTTGRPGSASWPTTSPASPDGRVRRGVRPLSRPASTSSRSSRSASSSGSAVSPVCTGPGCTTVLRGAVSQRKRLPMSSCPAAPATGAASHTSAAACRARSIASGVGARVERAQPVAVEVDPRAQVVQRPAVDAAPRR